MKISDGDHAQTMLVLRGRIAAYSRIGDDDAADRARRQLQAVKALRLLEVAHDITRQVLEHGGYEGDVERVNQYTHDALLALYVVLEEEL